MSKRLHYKRIILAAFSGLLIYLLFAFWPIRPLWQLNGQSLVGINAAKDLIYTIDKALLLRKNLSEFRVACWNLQSGQPVQIIDFQVPSLDYGSPYYRFLISPDASLLAIYANNKRFVQILRMDGARPQGQMIYLDDPLDSIGFSRDGKLIAINSGYFVRVWDTSSMKMVFDYKLNKQRQGSETVAFSTTKKNRVHFSDNARFLAVDTSINVHVFDLQNQKLLGITDCTGQPRFQPDDQSLVVMSNSAMPTITKYGIGENELNHLRQPSGQLLRLESCVDLSQEQYVTLQKREAAWRYPQWLPQSLGRKWLEWNFQWGWPHQLRIRNLSNNLIDAEITIPIHEQLGFDSNGELMHGQVVRLVDSLSSVIIEDNNGLTAWYIFGKRGWPFWTGVTIFSGLLLYCLIRSVNHMKLSHFNESAPR